MADVTCREQGQRECGGCCGCDRTIDAIIQIVEIPSVLAKIRRGFGIGGDQGSGASDDEQRWNPIAAARELCRKEPDILLVLEKSPRKLSPRNIDVLNGLRRDLRSIRGRSRRIGEARWH